MIVQGLDGREYKWNYAKYYKRKYRNKKSSYHIMAYNLLREVYSGYSIYEEVTLPGSKTRLDKSVLYADFFIPQCRVLVEVHGEQHYTFSSFFHQNQYEFLIAKKRDRDKIEWCSINDLTLFILPYNEKENWKQILLKV